MPSKNLEKGHKIGFLNIAIFPEAAGTAEADGGHIIEIFNRQFGLSHQRRQENHKDIDKCSVQVQYIPWTMAKIEKPEEVGHHRLL